MSDDTTKCVLVADRYSRVTNFRQIQAGREEGRTIAPVFEEHFKGEVLKLPPEDFDRLYKAGSVEKPGESQKRQQAELEAKREALQAQIDALENPPPADTTVFDVEAADAKSLQAEADRLDLKVEGTGKDGAVLADDNRDAIRAHQGG